MLRRVFSSLLVLIALAAGCSKQPGPSVDGDKLREYANALYNRELYDQAVSQYIQYLNAYSVPVEQQANINFIIGNIYFERLRDYENALAFYLKVRHLYPESQVATKVDKQIVACLERLQRSADAKQALDEATSINPDKVQKSRPGTVIAKIGDKEFTSGDLDYQIKQLPEYVQSQFTSKKAKVEFLKQYIATELFYDAAKRKGLDSDPEVIDGAFQAKKSLMVQKHLQQEIAEKVQIKPEDVQLYYQAHKDKYTEKDDKGKITKQNSFQEVQQQAAQDYVQEKQQAAYDELMQRMLSAENVVIYDDLVD